MSVCICKRLGVWWRMRKTLLHRLGHVDVRVLLMNPDNYTGFENLECFNVTIVSVDYWHWYVLTTVWLPSTFRSFYNSFLYKDSRVSPEWSDSGNGRLPTGSIVYFDCWSILYDCWNILYLQSDDIGCRRISYHIWFRECPLCIWKEHHLHIAPTGLI